MSYNQYLLSLNTKSLSKVKQLILKTLWEAGDSYPKGWVSSSRLLELTNQKYFDRRTRELRDELGCDIETRHINGEHHYRLKSETLNQANPRAYLTDTEKKKLFAAADYCCAICGKRAKAGVRGLQADHKIPLIRGGSHQLDNWQAICNDCNVSKRRSCQGCEENCKSCTWAFPEVLGVAVSLRLPVETVEEIRKHTADTPKWIAELVQRELHK
ncbi:HNH endonuclease [Aliiroseovarius sp. PrR006]|uniref:HNH endonuclease n=1 Tax=Aliiroseovarius sp. PrR006 TaxID=2706883 RepID=UPI0013D1F728|nr:HNH endonuclease [Aliiroseovarius sp. PrR006]NDW53614.1 HNH endonuclease [Aliiroseovarius sp. PrR006]